MDTFIAVTVGFSWILDCCDFTNLIKAGFFPACTIICWLYLLSQHHEDQIQQRIGKRDSKTFLVQNWAFDALKTWNASASACRMWCQWWWYWTCRFVCSNLRGGASQFKFSTLFAQVYTVCSSSTFFTFFDKICNLVFIFFAFCFAPCVHFCVNFFTRTLTNV